MTISTAIQEACPDLGLAKPLSVTAGNDATAERLLAIAHEAGDDIARRGDWSRMLLETLTGAQSTALPPDFARLIPGAGVYVSTPAYVPVYGPISSDQMQSFTRGAYGTPARLMYGIEDGALVLSRALVGEVVGFRWVRKSWLVNLGTYKTRATDDGDECLFPERLLSRAIVWRFRRETGQQYEDQAAEWEADLAMELRQDRGVTT